MDQLAFITGADRGLGLELVKQLLKKGYMVFAGRYLKCSIELEDLRQGNPGRLHLVEIDISDDSSVKKASDYMTTKTGHLDILINNAAILGDIEATIFDQLDFNEMQKVFNVNALGSLRVTQSLMPLIVKSTTKLIVNISSEAGSIGTCNRKGWFAYCMSKAALNMQSAIVHNQLKEFGGHVMLLHPGWLKTYMRGAMDEEAPLTAGESAESIVKLLLQHEKYIGDQPAFVDFQGNEMPW